MSEQEQIIEMILRMAEPCLATMPAAPLGEIWHVDYTPPGRWTAGGAEAERGQMSVRCSPWVCLPVEAQLLQRQAAGVAKGLQPVIITWRCAAGCANDPHPALGAFVVRQAGGTYVC